MKIINISLEVINYGVVSSRYNIAGNNIYVHIVNCTKQTHSVIYDAVYSVTARHRHRALIQDVSVILNALF